mgnify:CR=1 FL=1
MDTFGQFFLYTLVAIIFVSITSQVAVSIFNIPLFIAAPILLIAFWTVTQNSEKKEKTGDMSGESKEGTSTEDD